MACGGGTQTQTRTCSDPAPANGGQECEGEDVKTRECKTSSCSKPLDLNQGQGIKSSN